MEVYFDNLTAKNARLDKLGEEMETLAQNAEELVQAGGAALPAEERQKLVSLLARLKSTASQVKQQAVDGIKLTDRTIREHPYQTAGVALALGLLVGVLIGQSRRAGD